jgi:hypothetical protein
MTGVVAWPAQLAARLLAPAGAGTVDGEANETTVVEGLVAATSAVRQERGGLVRIGLSLK